MKINHFSFGIIMAKVVMVNVPKYAPIKVREEGNNCFFFSLNFIIHFMFFCLEMSSDWMIILSTELSVDASRFCVHFFEYRVWQEIDAQNVSSYEKSAALVSKCVENKIQKPKIIETLLKMNKRSMVEQLLNNDEKNETVKEIQGEVIPKMEEEGMVFQISFFMI